MRDPDDYGPDPDLERDIKREREWDKWEPNNHPSASQPAQPKRTENDDCRDGTQDDCEAERADQGQEEAA